MNDLKEKIKQLRENKNISQRELARMSGLSSSNISRLESGDIDPIMMRIGSIKNLADALGVKPSELINIDEL